MSQDARRHYEAIQRAVRAADGVIDGAGEEVLAAWNRVATGSLPVTEAQRRQFMRDVDTITASTFGTPAAGVAASPLFKAIIAESERLFVAQYKVGLDELDTIMKPYGWWPAQRERLINGSMSAARRDHLSQAYKIVYGPHVDKQRLLNAKLFEPQRTWVDARGHRLSNRIWKQGEAYRTAIDRTIQKGIRQGWSADRMAMELRQYVKPGYAPVKYTKSGRVYRVGNTYRPNAASAARRLARTEITRVHGQATIERSRDVPGVKGMRWRLSLQHPKADNCDTNATSDSYELGEGVYPLDNVPTYPDHPNCMCTLVPAHKSREETRQDIYNKYAPYIFTGEW